MGWDYLVSRWTFEYDVPESVKGKKVRLKGTSFFSSPINYRQPTDIAEGDGPSVNLGTVWMQRQGLPGAK